MGAGRRVAVASITASLLPARPAGARTTLVSEPASEAR